MQLMTLTRRLRLDRLFFSLMYRTGRPPWDTGIAPPELVEAVEGPHALPPGRALDLGCGTGPTASTWRGMAGASRG
jgi:methylase of polypeptide subunit release factors